MAQKACAYQRHRRTLHCLFSFAGILLVPVGASGAGELTLSYVTGVPCLCSFLMLSSHVLVVFGSCSRRLAARNRSFRRTGCVCACRPNSVGVAFVRALDHPFFRDFFFLSAAIFAPFF